MEQGLIVKAIGGFYYVKLSNNEIYSCRAKGLFRNIEVTPLVGDYVDFRIVSYDKKEGYIEKIHQRKNSIIRPPMANLDRLIIISSVINPVFDTLFIDKMLLLCEYNKIEPVICFNKIDLSDAPEIINDYRNIGYKVIRTSIKNKVGLNELKSVVKDGITAAVGFSGVGKSSLLNLIASGNKTKTGNISDKLRRGKHTTRHVEIFELGENTYFADTPGFSSLEIDMIRKEELPYLFIEFKEYIDSCMFKDCSHIKEKNCAVLNAVNSGQIPKFRHENYTAFYNKLKQIKDWERK